MSHPVWICMCAAVHLAWSTVGPGASWGLGNSTHRIYAWTRVSPVTTLRLFAWWWCLQSVYTNCAASSHGW